MNSVSYLIHSALIMTAAVFPWCFCMGTTFSLMMAFIKEREPADETGFSFLYLANVIGAVLGTILTADVLVELLGFRHTLLLAGCTNFFIAAASIVLASERPMIKQTKAPGYEYWTPRPGGRKPGRFTKNRTHRKERRRSRREEYLSLNDTPDA